ncbi:MAG: aldo/keto reductase [Planctomycetes bacterium]|nr:aldo/keto reductase [Planctomycetota bacterium]
MTQASHGQLSRRHFLYTAALGTALGPAAGLANPLAAAPAGAPAAAPEIFTPPPTVETRDGMPYRAFGKTGEKVSILGIGGYHIGVQASAEESTRIIRTAIDGGVNFMDNAWEYHKGLSEKRMGLALKDGFRRKVFLMTKVCGRDQKAAMSDLEDSLKRLETEVIDLWQFHECNYDNDPDWIFAKNGAIHAALKAREQGKIRFIGFTGHKSPHIHLKMLAQNFTWDSLQMPLNVLDSHYRSFARQVLPVALERGMGVVGMKPLGGDGGIPRSAGVTAEECLKYAFNLHIPVCLSGMDSVEVLNQNLRTAKSFKPLSREELESILGKVKEIAGDGRLERFKSTQDFDSTVHRDQHGLG